MSPWLSLTTAFVVVMVDMTISQGRSLMATNRSLSEVKARLSEYVRAAEHGQAVVITRHGQAVAAIVGSEELQTLQRLRAAGPQGGLASVAGGWEDSEDLVRILEASGRAATRTGPSLG